MAEEWKHLECPTIMKPQRLDIGSYTHNTYTEKASGSDCKTELLSLIQSDTTFDNHAMKLQLICDAGKEGLPWIFIQHTMDTHILSNTHAHLLTPINIAA